MIESSNLETDPGHYADIKKPPCGGLLFTLLLPYRCKRLRGRSHQSGSGGYGGLHPLQTQKIYHPIKKKQVVWQLRGRNANPTGNYSRANDRQSEIHHGSNKSPG
jgi:hypothetical protein